MSPEKSSHVVHENGKKRARHGRLAIPRQSLIRKSKIQLAMFASGR